MSVDTEFLSNYTNFSGLLPMVRTGACREEAELQAAAGVSGRLSSKGWRPFLRPQLCMRALLSIWDGRPFT